MTTGCFEYQDGALHCEQVPAEELAAGHGTPLYVYSRQALLSNLEALRSAFAPLDPRICFSLKSCQNLHLLRLLAGHGCGFDVVSGGELQRALEAGADPRQIVFAGVGKTDHEIRAALAAGVGLLNVESLSELEVLAGLARETGTQAHAALRINPDVDAHTHAYTTTGTRENKFGVDMHHVRQVFARAAELPAVCLRGLHVHIGSPITQVASFRDAIAQVLAIRDTLQRDGFTIDTLDLGGGLPAQYGDHPHPPLQEFADAVCGPLREAGVETVLEPGRVIAATAGLLLTRVLHVKRNGSRVFVVTDASMNELLRPALYQAYHFIWPVRAGKRVPQSQSADQPWPDLVPTDVVGPICETTDFLARGRPLPPLERGDLLAVFATGAYSMTMASQYNSRPRAAEVLVAGRRQQRIRRRETYDDLVAAERDLPEMEP